MPSLTGSVTAIERKGAPDGDLGLCEDDLGGPISCCRKFHTLKKSSNRLPKSTSPKSKIQDLKKKRYNSKNHRRNHAFVVNEDEDRLLQRSIQDRGQGRNAFPWDSHADLFIAYLGRAGPGQQAAQPGSLQLSPKSEKNRPIKIFRSNKKIY